MTPAAKRSLLTSVVAVATVLLSVWRAHWVPDARPASAPADAFSATRAMEHVREIARAPHPAGSAEHARVRAYLLQALGRIGVPAEVQETTGIGTRYAAAGRVRNVVARLAGAEPGPAVLLLAHYDAVPVAPGAGDDASGSAVLLETLRALRADGGGRLRHDVIALFADAEEAGLLGAAAFVREHPWARDVAVTINVEARGTHGPSLMFETGAGNLDVARELRGAPAVRATSLSTAVYRRLPNDTDLSELFLLDRPALNFAFIGGVDRYHTSEDDVAHLDPRSVQHHGDHVLAMARAFASEPLPRPVTPDAVFFDFPALGLVVYPERWAVPLAVIALVVAVTGVILLRRREPAWLRGVLIGAGATCLSTLLAAALAFAVVMVAGRVHAMIGSGRADQSAAYAAAAALVALAATAASWGLARRWADERSLHAGAVIAWAALSLLVAVALPGGSFLFTWPLLLAAAAFLASLRWQGAVAHAADGTAGFLVLLLVVPITWLMGVTALGLGQGSVLIGAICALVAWLLAPVLVLLGDRSWKVAGTAGAAALALVLIGVLTNRTTAANPAGTTISYIADADSGSAVLTGAGQGPAARRWVESELRRMTSGTPVGGLPASLQRLIGTGPSVTAPPTRPTRADVTVVSDSSRGAERVVTIRIVPAPGTLGVRMRADSVRDARVDGRPVDASRYRSFPRGWSLEYVAPDPAGYTLTLTVPASEGTVLELLSRRNGLPAEVTPPERREGLIPIQRGDATYVLQRVRL